MHVTKKQRNTAQRQLNLSANQVQVVDVRRQAQRSVTATLVCRQQQVSVLNLELHQRQAGRLVGLNVGFSKEKHVVLAAAFFRIDAIHQPW